jgi:SecD/SecF fusion protein
MDAKIAGNSQSNWSPKATSRLVAFQDTAAPTQPPTAEATSIDPAISGAATTPSIEAKPAEPTYSTSVDLAFKATKGTGTAKLNASQVLEGLTSAAAKAGRTLVDAQIELQPVGGVNWIRSSEVGYPEWKVKLPFDEATTKSVIEQMQAQIRTKPVFQSFSQIEGRVAGEMQQRAILGLLLSLIFITIYIWFRFNKVSYGIAAVIALIHDVLITIAFLAVSHWLFKPLGFLLIEDFKISLTIVAAILTIIGYSLNDTIVVFDRIREVKGKSPNLTEEMINTSVTQTLSRTLLTSSTTILAILLMYIWGGEGIHGFAFCLLIGILVGTYSSIFVAAPILLWLSKREQAARAASKVS